MSGDRSVYIRYIYDCICYVEAYTQGGQDEFFRDRKTQDAVIRNIEVIGQAVKDFGIDELTATNRQIPLEQNSRHAQYSRAPIPGGRSGLNLGSGGKPSACVETNDR